MRKNFVTKWGIGLGILRTGWVLVIVFGFYVKKLASSDVF